MELKDLNDINTHLENNVYNHIKLINSATGKDVIRYNPVKGKLQERKNQIIEHLNNPATPEGVYVIKISNGLQGNVDTLDLIYKKGNPSPEQLSERPIMKDSKREEFLSWDKALEYEKKILELEQKIHFLEKDLEDLEEELDEPEETQEPETINNPELLSTPQAQTILNQFGWVKDVLPSVVGIFETHFELKKKNLEIREMELRNQGQGPRTIPQEMESDMLEIMEFLKGLKKENPDTFSAILDQIKNPQQQPQQ